MARAELQALRGRTFAAVLFDLDGTLVDSTPAVERSWRRLASEYGVQLEGFGTWHGIPAAQAVPMVLGAERGAEGARRLEELEVADVDGVVPLPGAAEALAAVPAGRAAIATSCTSVLAAARIGATGLRVPQVVVTADDTAIGKPDPAPYLLAARRLGVDPRDCLVIEDAPAGLAAARAAGAASLAVSTSHDADDLMADAVVGTLADVRFMAGPDGVRVVGAGEID